MRALFRRTVAQLAALPETWLYVIALSGAGAGVTLLSLWTDGVVALGDVCAHLLSAQMLLLPMLFLNAFRRDRALGVDRLLLQLPLREETRVFARLLGYLCLTALAACVGAIAPVCAAWRTDHALFFALTCAIGCCFSGIAMAGVCFCVAARVRNRVGYLCCAYGVLALFYAMPLCASKLSASVPGVWLARVILGVSPVSLFNRFQNGILDLRALCMLGALALLCGYIACSLRRTRCMCMLCAVFMLLFAAQPAAYTQFDATPSRLCTPSAGIFAAVATLDRPVQLTLVAVPGEEDPWLDAYCARLGGRAPNVRYRRIAPVEDADIQEKAPAQAMLGVGYDDVFVWMTAQSCYVDRESTTTFEAEGCILALLEDATGQSMLADADIRFVDLARTTYATTDEIAAQTTLIGACAFIIPCIVAVWRRKKRYV